MKKNWTKIGIKFRIKIDQIQNDLHGAFWLCKTSELRLYYKNKCVFKWEFLKKKVLIFFAHSHVQWGTFLLTLECWFSFGHKTLFALMTINGQKFPQNKYTMCNLPFDFLLLTTKSDDGSNRTQDLLSDGSSLAVSRQFLLCQSCLWSCDHAQWDRQNLK